MLYCPLVPGITVAGQTIGVFFETLQSFPVLREALLEVLGVQEVDADMWFPQDKVLLAYQKVDYLLGGRGLERFGGRVPSLAMLPPDIGGAHELLSKLDAVYHLNHRRDGVAMLDFATGVELEGIGHYRYERVGEREGVMVCDDPYPCRFDLGLCRAFAARFEPTATAVHEQGSCRDDGDPQCTYRLRW